MSNVGLACAMKYQNKHDKKRWNKKSNIGTSNNAKSRKIKLSNRWRIMYDRRYKKYKLIAKQASPDDYVFYSILNTNIAMELGEAASMITRSIIKLYDKLAADKIKNMCIELWHKSGQNIVVLQGYDHRHLKFLEGEVKFAALGKHAIYQRLYHNRIMLALSVFGRKAEIEDIFDGLSYLR